MVTAEDLKRDAVNSVDIDFTDEAVQPGIGKSYKQIADQAIADAQGYVEGYLDRKLDVQAYAEYIEADDWHYNNAREKYVHYAEHYPITAVTTTGVTADNNMLLSSETTKKVEYSAGYTTLPTDIRRVISNIAMYLILTSYDKLVAYQSMDKNIGGVQTTTSKDSMYIERELKRLEGYQRLQ